MTDNEIREFRKTALPECESFDGGETWLIKSPPDLWLDIIPVITTQHKEEGIRRWCVWRDGVIDEFVIERRDDGQFMVHNRTGSPAYGHGTSVAEAFNLYIAVRAAGVKMGIVHPYGNLPFISIA